MFEYFLGPFFLALWVMFLVPAGVLSGPLIFLGRHRAQWRLWELSAFVLPYWTWVVCNLIDCSGKSLSNAAIEPICIAVAVSPAVLIRVAIGRPSWRWRVSAALIGVLCCLGVALWAFVPGLPE